jgi:hypothetical protein
MYSQYEHFPGQLFFLQIISRYEQECSVQSTGIHHIWDWATRLECRSTSRELWVLNKVDRILITFFVVC